MVWAKSAQTIKKIMKTLWARFGKSAQILKNKILKTKHKKRSTNA